MNALSHEEDYRIDDWDPLLRNFHFQKISHSVIFCAVLLIGVIGIINYPSIEADFQDWPTVDYSSAPYSTPDMQEYVEYALMSLLILRFACTPQITRWCCGKSFSFIDQSKKVENTVNDSEGSSNQNFEEIVDIDDFTSEVRGAEVGVIHNIGIENDKCQQLHTPDNAETLHYMNNIKSLLILLVIFAHVTVIFIGSRWFYSIGLYRSKFNYVFSTLLLLGQGFVMSLFCFISGYFTARSYHNTFDANDGKVYYRRKRFLDRRFFNIGFPLLLYYFGCGPMERLYARNYVITPDPILSMFIEEEDDFKNYVPVAGVFWYLFLLLSFTAVYSCFPASLTFRCKEGAVEEDQKSTALVKRPSFLWILLVGLICGALQGIQVTWLTSFPIVPIHVSSLVLYILFFVAGVFAYHHRLESILRSISNVERLSMQAFTATFIIVIFILFYYDYRDKLKIFLPVNDCNKVGDFPQVSLPGYAINGFGDWTIFAMVICSLFGMYTVAMNFFLIDFFYRRVNFTSKLLTFASDNAFAVYLLHSPVVTLICSLYVRSIDSDKTPIYFVPNTTFSNSCVDGENTLLYGWILCFFSSIAILYPLAVISRKMINFR